MKLLSWLLASGILLFASPSGLAAAPKPLEIAVIGGSGMIGQRIVREALDRSHRVTVIVRDPTKVDFRHERMQVQVGDALDGAGIARLAAGHDVLVSAVGSARDVSPDPTLYRKVAESLVGALRNMGEDAPRLLVVGGVGSLKDDSGQLVLERVPEDRRPEHLGQKAALDYYLTVDDVRWTYLSPPGVILPGNRSGTYRVGEDSVVVDPKTGYSHISMEDYAVAMVDEAENARHIGKRFTVGY